ncbi:MAG: GerMN domain-containing protein [Treponema sp.]|nr:GerMN domain-containing protein [Treponema sp.]
MAKRDVIEKNFNLFMDRLSSRPEKEETPQAEPEKGGAADKTADELTPAPHADEPIAILPKEEPVLLPLDKKPVEQKPIVETQPPVQERPPVKRPEPQVKPPARQPEPQKPPPKPVETRDRNIYFTHVDNDGQIIRSRVSRKIAVSDSPLHDSINVLLAGPAADERNRGIVSLIPPKTRLLTAIVRGTTAYLNFSEDFIFNTYGAEGFIAQLRQVVWTATEFPTVDDVQILIEGKRVDYLGEGVWIGSPINRDSY